MQVDIMRMRILKPREEFHSLDLPSREVPTLQVPTAGVGQYLKGIVNLPPHSLTIVHISPKSEDAANEYAAAPDAD